MPSRSWGCRRPWRAPWDGVRRARELGFQVRSDFGIGVYNSQTLKELKKLGVEGATAPSS